MPSYGPGISSGSNVPQELVDSSPTVTRILNGFFGSGMLLLDLTPT
jgi:hypothetical protein